MCLEYIVKTLKRGNREVRRFARRLSSRARSMSSGSVYYT